MKTRTVKDDAKETTGSPVDVEVTRHSVGTDRTMTYRMTRNVSVDVAAILKAFEDERARVAIERDRPCVTHKTPRYRCRYTIEAVRWVDTPECREVMARWFESHGDEFVTRGSTGVLPRGDDEQNVEVGEWVLRMDSNWVVMDDEMFRDEYEMVTEAGR